MAGLTPDSLEKPKRLPFILTLRTAPDESTFFVGKFWLWNGIQELPAPRAKVDANGALSRGAWSEEDYVNATSD
jgi:hypothetical protein